MMVRTSLSYCRLLSKTTGVHLRSASSVSVDKLLTTKAAQVEQLSDQARPRPPFAKALTGSFFQERPQLHNVYQQDSLLVDYLRRVVPQEILDKFTPDLERFGQRVVDEIDDLGRQCEVNPPKLETLDAWGNRRDNLITCDAWKRQKTIAAEEGLIAIPYEQNHGPYSRLHWAAKVLMYNPSSGLYSCPLAMTDGAAAFFKKFGDKFPDTRDRVLSHLLSRNADNFWTSGQWMTERKGGSDVANGTETVAVKQTDGSYKLYGYKWFSSATDSNMTLTLARIVDDNGGYTQGTSGVSLFYLETRNVDGTLNGIQIEKLKDKLGTRQVPTAELLLDGATAVLVSDEGRGVASISPMLNITRTHNALTSVAIMRRIVHLARDYSHRRRAFGKMIRFHPLHMQTLARMEVETRGNLMLVLHACYLLGLDECGLATDHDQQLLRLLIPIAKLYTAKQAIAITSEGLESFGGQGYIEETGLPVMLRDAQVLSIWEGTTNILSLDVLRSISKTSGGTLSSLLLDVQTRLGPLIECDNEELKVCAGKINEAAGDLGEFAKLAGRDGQISMEAAARDFAYSIARVYIASLLAEHAASGNENDVTVTTRWCEQCLCPVVNQGTGDAYTQHGMLQDTTIVMDGYQEQ